MSSGDKLAEVIRDLERVKISHERTGKLIENLSEKILLLQAPKEEITERSFTIEESRYLLGRRVRITNPAKREPNVGKILSVGKLFITVDLGEGLKRNRIAKNLKLID